MTFHSSGYATIFVSYLVIHPVNIHPNMINLIIALLLDLGIIQSPTDFYESSSEQQQEYIDEYGDDQDVVIDNRVDASELTLVCCA